MRYATPLNTRIFAGNFQFGEFHAILRGVVVKKIHNSSAEVGCPNYSALMLQNPLFFTVILFDIIKETFLYYFQ